MRISISLNNEIAITSRIVALQSGRTLSGFIELLLRREILKNIFCPVCNRNAARIGYGNYGEIVCCVCGNLVEIKEAPGVDANVQVDATG